MTEQESTWVMRDGVAIIHDPIASEVIAELEKYTRQNLDRLLELNRDRVDHFVRRMSSADHADQGDMVVVCVQVDDPTGRHLARLLMPGHNWQTYRDRGQEPIARGLAKREGIQQFLDLLLPEAARVLTNTKGTPIVVVGYGSALVVQWETFR